MEENLNSPLDGEWSTSHCKKEHVAWEILSCPFLENTTCNPWALIGNHLLTVHIFQNEILPHHPLLRTIRWMLYFNFRKEVAEPSIDQDSEWSLHLLSHVLVGKTDHHDIAKKLFLIVLSDTCWNQTGRREWVWGIQEAERGQCGWSISSKGKRCENQVWEIPQGLVGCGLECGFYFQYKEWFQ